MVQKTTKAVGPDGQTREIKIEHQLNEAFMLCFKDKAGENCLNWLRSITTNKALSSPVDTNTLMHLEGARWLVGIISQRVDLGRKGLPKLGGR
jgi:hypothetical protein